MQIPPTRDGDSLDASSSYLIHPPVNPGALTESAHKAVKLTDDDAERISMRSEINRLDSQQNNATKEGFLGVPKGIRTPVLTVKG